MGLGSRLLETVADLHPLELLAILGGAVAASLALLAPDSRARIVAAWVLLGTVIASAVVAGPSREMYSLYLLAVVLALAAWLSSRRVLASPVRQVWRTGRGSGEEHVPETAAPASSIARILLFAVALALLAVPLGVLPVPPLLP